MAPALSPFLPDTGTAQAMSCPVWGNRSYRAQPLCRDRRAYSWAEGRIVLPTLVKPMSSVLLLHAVISKVPIRRRKKFMHRGEVKGSVTYNGHLGGK